MSHVSLITLGVSDIDSATRFYESLGWHRSSASVDGIVAFMRGGATVLGLFGSDDLAADAGVTQLDPTGAAIALAMNVADAKEVDEVLVTVAGAGGSVTRKAAHTDWGGYSGYFQDLDGHLWEVAFNPGFGLLPDGRIVLPDD